ncbi:DUF1212-domain-containing protein [Ramicandelaber brevisporus]|nr:DUF1212-domain-containing protein [Ramicandelaber brevisporus]
MGYPEYFGPDDDQQWQFAANIAEILQKQDFLILLAKAFMKFGAPSHRLEQSMDLVAKHIEVEAAFVMLPNLMIIAFGDPDTHTSETHIVKVGQGYDMDRLERSNMCARRIIKGKVSVGEAIQELEAIIKAPPIYPWWVEILNFGASAFFVAPLAFGGGWLDAAVAGVLGLLVGVMKVMADKFAAYANMFEITATVVIAVIATSMREFICYWPVTLAATVILLPGLILTTSVIELASRNVVSGAVRLFWALLLTFIMGFGLSLGTTIYNAFASAGDKTQNQSIHQSCPGALSPYWYFLLLPPLSISFSMHLFARPSQFLANMIISAIGFSVSYFTSKYLDFAQVSPAISAFALGVAGNLYMRITGDMGYATILTAILLLVPGSIGVRGILALISQDSAGGATFSLNMIVIALSITVGLFAATFVVFPKGKKRSALLTY